MRRSALAPSLLAAVASGCLGCHLEARGLGEPDAALTDDTSALAEVEPPLETGGGDADPSDSFVFDAETAVSDALEETTAEIGIGDWAAKGWTHRRRLAVDPFALTADLANFVVPVVIDEPDLVGKATLDGRDLRFIAPDGAPLSFEIARWEGSTGKLFAWVKLPKIGPALPNEFYLYYSNTVATFADDPVKTWAGEEAVWHFDEATTDGGTMGKLVDRTGGGHDGAQNGSASIDGLLLGAQRFDGKDLVDVARPNEIVLGNVDCTVVAWMRTTDTRQQGILIKAKGETHETGDKLFGTGHDAPSFGVDHGWVGFAKASPTVTDGMWHHVAWVQNKDATGMKENWKLYVDGAEKGSADYDTKPDVMGHTVRIGGKAAGSYFDNPWTGDLDEIRYAKVARGPAWIAALERSQRDPKTFVSVGPDETLGK